MDRNDDRQQRFDPALLKQLVRLDLRARVIVDGLRHGLHRSRLHGFSTEFSDFKPYVSGDNLRFLDWRLFARTDRLFVKCFEAETSLELMLLLDATESMAWRWRDWISKLEYGVNLLAALACLHMRQQDQVGLLVHDARTLHFLPPRCRRSQLEAIFAVLEDVRPGRAEAFPELIQGLAEMKRHRGVVVVCSDLEEEQDAVAAALRALAATGHEIILFHLLDRAEIEMPFAEATHLRDTETGAVIPANIRVFRREYEAGVRRFRSEWRTQCEQAGILYSPLDTGLGYVDAIQQTLSRRAARRRGGMLAR